MPTVPLSFSTNQTIVDGGWDSRDAEVSWLRLEVPLESPSGYSDHTSNSGMLTYDTPALSGRYGRWDNTPVGGAVSKSFSVVDGQFTAERIAGSAPFNITLAYHFDEPVPLGTKILTSYWVKHKALNEGAKGQFKFARWKSEWSISDTESECYVTANSNNLAAMMYIRNSQIHLTEPRAVQYFEYDGMPVNTDIFTRVDIEYDLPSDFSTADFKTYLTTYDPTGVELPFRRDLLAGDPLEKTPYRSAEDMWRYLIFQNWFGNDSFQTSDQVISLQSIFVSVGSLARVELSNSLVYEDSTKREILAAQSWTNGVIRVNALPKFLLSGTRYVHVFDDSGEIIYSEEVSDA